MDFAELGFRVDSSHLRRGDRDLEKFTRTAQQTDARVSRSAQSVSRSFGHVAVGIGAAVAAVGGIGGATTTIAGFEQAISKVSAISGATGGTLAEMRDMAMDFGSTTEFTATNAAEALTFLAMAGFDAEQAMASLPTVLDLATASGMGLGQTADQLSNIMSTFSIEAQQAGRVADILAQQAASSNTSVTQLAQAVSYAGGQAAVLGMDVETTAAALGVLANNGLQATRGGTALNMVMVKLASFTKPARDALERFGISTEDITLETHSLAEALDVLAAANLDTAAMTALVGAEQVDSLSMLMKGRQEITRYADAAYDAAGASGEMAATMRDNLQGDMNGFTSAVEGLTLSMGEKGLTGIMRTVIQTATGFVRAISGFEHLGTVGAVLGGIAAAATALIFPLTAVGVALAGAAVYAVANWEDLKTRFPGVVSVLQSGADMAVQAFEWVKGAVAGFGPTFQNLASAAKAVFTGDWAAAWDAAKAAGESYASWWDSFVLTPISETQWGQAIADSSVFEGAEQYFTSFAQSIGGWLDLAGTNLQDAWAQIGPTLENIRSLWSSLSGMGGDGGNVTAFLGGFADTMAQLAGLGLGVVSTAIEGVARAIETVTGAAAAAASGDWARFVTEFREFFDWALGGAIGQVNDILMGLPDTITSAVNSMATAVSNGVPLVKQGFADLWTEIKQEVSTWPGQMIDIGGDVMDGLIQGIKSKATGVIDAISETADSATEWMKNKLGIQSPSRVFRTIGEQTGQGFIDGVASMVARANATVGELVGGGQGIKAGTSFSDKEDMADGWISRMTPQIETYKQQLAELAQLNAEGFFADAPQAYADAVADVANKLNGVDTGGMQSTISSLSNAVAGQIMNGGEQVEQALMSLAQQYLAKSIDTVLNSIFGSLGGGGGFLSSIFGGGGTPAYSGNIPTGAYASYEGGGDTWSGPRTGGVDGRGGRFAILHSNETVIDHTKGGGFGSSKTEVNMPVNVNNYGAKVSTQRNAAGGLDINVEQAIDDYFDSGRGNRAMKRNYSLRPTPKGA